MIPLDCLDPFNEEHEDPKLQQQTRDDGFIFNSAI